MAETEAPASSGMAPQPFTHSQSLRVIGQRLHALAADWFELRKAGDQYIVRMDPRAEIGKLPGCRVGHEIGQDSFPDPIDAAPLCCGFTAAEIATDDDQQRRRRIKPNGVADINHLSVVLRVLGDYLDRHAAADFVILWSQHSVEVRYGAQAQVFTVQNLYDLGMIMYLKSSVHASKESLPPPAQR